MLHHISFAVTDLEKSSEFYDSCFFELGYRRVFTGQKFVGYGTEDGKDKFGLFAVEEGFGLPEKGFHLAFSASRRADVDRFYAAALKHGGTDNGEPGLRPHYGEHYYAAYIIDPDGYHIEAVINGPEN